MTKLILFLTFFLFSTGSFAAAYLGGNYGYSMFSSDSLKEYKVSSKGPTYGAFLGIGRDFVGLEGFYQSFTASGKVKHDDGTHNLETNAVAMGLALRFSFELLYLRLGVARYTLDQSLDIGDDDSRQAGEVIYDIQEKGATKNGVLYGIGLHHKFSWCRGFIDFSRYQINSIGNYDAFTAGLSFTIPERWFNFGKY